MTPRAIFGLIIRTCGLFLVYQGLQTAVFPVAALLNGQLALIGFIAPAIYLSAGAYFLRGAPELMRFCYPPED